MKTALFIRHKAQSGKRDEVRRVWEKHVKPRAAANPEHEAYYFCFDRNDPDVISVFQLYTDTAAMTRFLEGAWYREYLQEVRPLVSAEPRLITSDLIWAKGSDPQA